MVGRGDSDEAAQNRIHHDEEAFRDLRPLAQKYGVLIPTDEIHLDNLVDFIHKAIPVLENLKEEENGE